jgi:SAM-dependent methyltransferase
MALSDYPLGSSDHERRRLMRQADVLAEATERLFRKAGIESGMRVLDLGSGSGDVSLLVRKLVGESGDVTGVDMDQKQVEFAQRRVQSLGYSNVHFVASDYQSLVLEMPVDAIVGRLVLGFANDPIAALSAVCRNLRSGGIVALHENNMEYDAPVLIEPMNGLAAKAAGWINAGLRHSGVHSRVGLKLFGIMKTAGLDPSPQIEAMMNISQGPQGRLFASLAGLVRSAMPSIIASGAATATEIDIDSLEQRLIDGAPKTGVVGTISAGFVSVWARKP